MHDLTLCGWRVASQFPIPDLAPWIGDARDADIVIRLGKVPERLDELVHESPLFQVAADGRCRFIISEVAAYLIKGGSEIVVDPYIELSSPDIRVFLLGTVLGVLCHQRGVIPVHASCVDINGKAALFAGPSGVGKSTLAAGFMRRGYSVLADDVTVVQPDGRGGYQVFPSFPRLKLWSRSADALGLAYRGEEQSRQELEKYHLRLQDQAPMVVRPLGSIHHMGVVHAPQFEKTEALTRQEALPLLMRSIYRLRAARRLDPTLSRVTSTAVTVAMSCPRHWRRARSHNIEQLDALVTSIIASAGN